MECKKGSEERKKFINLLRKEGNFSLFFENKVRPVQRPDPNKNTKDVSLESYLPCKFCKGFYKIHSLRRHAKNCSFNTEKFITARYASEGQTMIAFTESRKKFLNRLRLKSEVFNTMHPDKISFNGKSDPIICQYAEDYLRKHKRPHIKNVVANKIRELGRLLVPLQNIYKINTILESLKPENFDHVVSAVRIISGYNESSKSFRAPSLALHFKTILLGVCTAAKTLLIKKDPILPVTSYEHVLKDLKKFRELVDQNWKFEMGSLALKDLNEKCSLKPKKIPVTQDIILFKNYCHGVANKAVENLSVNLNSIDIFKTLCEACIGLTILLNRKRVGDVQYLKLENYTLPEAIADKEEYMNLLSEEEKELSKHFKRVISIGKGNKTVPILFPKKIQNYIDFMLEVRRKTTFVPKSNPFLFAQINTPSKWINGSNVLRKFAVACGAQHPDTLTSSRLRKQIATILQILNLNEIEMEQIATFMGHTKKTHEQFYR